MRDYLYRLAVKIQTFMQGRNGMDNLNRAIFIGYFVLSFLNSRIIRRVIPPMSVVIRIILILLAILLVFRMLSKDISKRRNENELWLMFTYKASRKQSLLRERAADKTHVYRKCPSCKRTIRLKRAKGKHKVECPKCQREFSVFIIG